ncbi:hypothetical protein PRABACTJOHN_04536, partial [Parabacteroides johnsonii DSM 18315]
YCFSLCEDRTADKKQAPAVFVLPGLRCSLIPICRYFPQFNIPRPLQSFSDRGKRRIFARLNRNRQDKLMKFENENWAQFKGETWKKEINVRDFIQNNYKPYDGDDTFLVPSSEKTKKVWNKLTEMFKVEREKGVYDAETKLPQGIDTYGPGYIDKENEVIVGLQTDAPLKRGIFPKGG